MTDAFDPTKPAPTIKEFQADFQPTVADIDAVHGTRNTENKEEMKRDDVAIRALESSSLKHNWSAPWFECKDLSKYHVENPGEDFPRMVRLYESVRNVWEYNMTYTRGIKSNDEVPKFARLDQALNGDLNGPNAKRRQHLVGLLAYCWQLRGICQDEARWLKDQKQQKAQRDKERERKKKKKKEKKETTPNIDLFSGGSLLSDYTKKFMKKGIKKMQSSDDDDDDDEDESTAESEEQSDAKDEQEGYKCYSDDDKQKKELQNGGCFLKGLRTNQSNLTERIIILQQNMHTIHKRKRLEDLICYITLFGLSY
eukprot:86691_1